MIYLIIAESGLAAIQLTNQIKALNLINEVEQYNNIVEALKNKSRFNYEAIFIDFAPESEYHIQTFLSLLTSNQAQSSAIAWLKTKINDAFTLDLLDRGLQVFCPLYPSKIQLGSILTAQSNEQNYLTLQVFSTIREAALENRRVQTPTATESKVLGYILEFKSNQDIANELGISVSSVKSHIGNLNQKFNTRNRNELRTIAESYSVAVRDRSQSQSEMPTPLPQRRRQRLA